MTALNFVQRKFAPCNHSYYSTPNNVWSLIQMDFHKLVAVRDRLMTAMKAVNHHLRKF